MTLGIGLRALLLSSSIALPGGAPVGMDYLVYDPANQRVWVPAGNTGNVDVVDVVTGKVTAIGGFATAPSKRAGRPNAGPSSATVGAGVVWVGNRADSKLCAFDAKSLEKRRCLQLAAMPDGLAYVAPTHELWATTPAEKSIAIVDEEGKRPVANLKVEGSPEGYAVDAARGRFYTNLEDKDATLAIDIRARKVVATWSPGCGKEGPRGLAVDGERHLLLVACTSGVVALDLEHGGKVLGRLDTGAGVDNLDYSADGKLLYVAAREAATLTVARVSDLGTFSVVSTLPTVKGARNAVVDSKGCAYVADSQGGTLVVLPAPSAH